MASDKNIPQGDRSHCPVCGKKWPLLKPWQGVVDCSLCGAPMHWSGRSPCFRRAKSEADLTPEYLSRVLGLFPGAKAQTGPEADRGRHYYFCPSCFKVAMNRLIARSELVGRNEDAAQAYEYLGMYEKARLTREQGKRQTISHVSVNLNDLIDSIRRKGLALPYKCPSCGATITVDGHTRVEGLKFCSYCGSGLNTDVLAKVLLSALG